MALAPAGSSTAGLSVLTLDENGVLGHAPAGGAWRALDTLERQHQSNFAGAMSWRAPGDVLIGWTGNPRMLHFRQGGLRPVFGPSELESPCALITREGGERWAMFGAAGNLARYDGERWGPPLGALGGAGCALLPFGEGFVAGGERGLLRQYVPGTGFCPPASSALQYIRAGMRFADGRLLFLAGSGGSTGSSMLWLETN